MDFWTWLESNKPKQYFHFGPYVYDVEKATEYIKAHEHEVQKQEVDISQLRAYFGLFIKINPEHVKNVNIEEPGIMVVDPDLGGGMLIDGWHRAKNLFDAGVSVMTCWIITDPKVIKSIRRDNRRR